MMLQPHWPPSAIGIDPADYADGQVPVKDAAGLFIPGAGGGGAVAVDDDGVEVVDDVARLNFADGLAVTDDGDGAVTIDLPNETVLAPDHTVDSTGGGFTVSLDVTWGIDATGDPYHNPAGVTSGEEAVLVLDNTTGKFALRPIEV